MTKPSRYFGSRSHVVLILILVSLVVSLTVALAATAAPSPASKSSKPGSPAADLTPRVYMPIIARTEWTELARSPGGSYDSQTLGRWRRVSWDAYAGCHNAAICPYVPFEPTNPSDPTWGSEANWWTVGYNDSSWSRQGWVHWSTVWELPQWHAISAIGPYAWSAERFQFSRQTDLHRRQVTLNFKALSARITIFSDNDSAWYINGHMVVSDTQGGIQSNISPDWLHCGDNLMAVQVSNDDDINPVNPFGLQYIVEAVLDSSQPCKPSPVLTTTATMSATAGQAIRDTAHLSSTAPLTGTITFNVYGPNDASCSTPIAVPPAIPVNGAGNYQSGNYTPTLAGLYRWIARYSGDANNQAVTTQCNDPNETTTVTSTLTPTLTTTASGPATVGQAIHDMAYLTGGRVPLTGTLTFDVYGPDDANCSAPIAVPPAVAVNGAGNYQSGDYTPTVAGAYRWIAHYSGNATNPAVNTACNDLDETSTVFTLTLTTNASPVPSGQTIFDTAHLRGGHGTPSGTLTFDVFAPNDVTCSTPIAVPPAVTVNGAGDYASGNYTPTLIGAYRWIAHYSGDGINPALSTACADPAEISNVQPGLTLAKSASPTTYNSVGDVITYTYTVTNTGHATLSGPVMVNDDRLGTFACGPAADLIPGASVACTRTYVIQPGDLGNVLRLPIQQLTNATYGTWLGGVNSTMDVILSGNASGSDVPNGTYAGWCVEEHINGNLYNQLATLYTSTHLNLPSDVAGLSWGKVNHILNHKIRGIGKTDSEFFQDVQTAIWVVLGESTPTWGISFDAQQMIDAANAHPGYVPGPTDTVAVIVYSDGIHSTGSDLIQEDIIEAKLGQITNRATATATVGGITATSNQAVVIIQFVPVYNAVSIKIQKPPAVKSKF